MLVEGRSAKRLDMRDVSGAEVPNDLLGEVQNCILTVVQVRMISSVLLKTLQVVVCEVAHVVVLLEEGSVSASNGDGGEDLENSAELHVE